MKTRLQSLPVILAAALLLRVLFFVMYIQSHPQRALATIPFLFEPGNIANALATGHGFANPFRVETGPTAWMPPVYPLLLAAIFRLFGTYTFAAYLAAAGLNVVFSALTCLPVYLAGRRLASPRTAAIAAWLWAIFPNAILLPCESLFEASLSALLAATLIWATLVVAENRSRLASALYGVLWGIALLTNAALAILLPFFAFRLRQARLFPATLALLVCLTPWTVRNFLVFHTFVPLRSVAGLALWLGNNDQADSRTPGSRHPITNQDEREHYAQIGEMAYMREKQSEALSWMAAWPSKVLQLAAERFVAIWTGGSAHPLDDARRARSFRFWIVTGANLLAAIGAWAGLIALWRRRDPAFLLLGAFIVVFPLAYYLTLAPPRYRHPADPAILLVCALTGRLRK